MTETHSSQGEAEVYLDGVLVDTVDTYLDPAQGRGRAAGGVQRARPRRRQPHHPCGQEVGRYVLLDRFDVVQQSLIDVGAVVFDRAAPADAMVHILRDPGELGASSATAPR